MVEAWRTDIIARKSWTREQIIAEGRAQSPTWAEVEWGPWADAKLQVNPAVFDWADPQASPAAWRDVVRKITCPILVVTADPELGAIVSSEVAHEAAKLNSGLQIAHIPGAGHNIRRERFEAYLAAVAAFLDENMRQRKCAV